MVLFRRNDTVGYKVKRVRQDLKKTRRRLFLLPRRRFLSLPLNGQTDTNIMKKKLKCLRRLA